MKKRTSRVSRRIVSLLMSMVLTLTLVTPAAFATEVVDGSGTTIVEGDTNPADANHSEESAGKDDVDKNTEDSADEQQPANPGDEDKNPGESEGDANKPAEDNKGEEKPDEDKKDEEHKDKQSTEDENNGEDDISLLNAENGVDVWAGADAEDGIDTSWYNTTDKTFEIKTAAQLAGLAKLVNDGTAEFSGKTIKLVEDIDLDNREWTPIGNENENWDGYAFKGTFDGDGHTIRNLNVPDTALPGLFGRITGVIQNLIVLGEVHAGNIAANEYEATAGGIVCCGTNVTVQNCGFYGTIYSGNNTYGAILGSGNGATVRNCWNYIVDEDIWSEYIFNNRTNLPSCIVISSDDSGESMDESKLTTLNTDIPNTGKMWAWSEGDEYPHLIDPPKTITFKPIFQDCTAVISVNGKELDAGNNYTYEVTGDVTITASIDGIYYGSEGAAENARTEITSGGVLYTGGFPATLFYGTEDDFDAVIAWNRVVSSGYKITDEDGTQLKALARMVNSGKDSMAGKTITLGANIDLENASWTSIGTETNPFKGTFNGGVLTGSGWNQKLSPHTISNLNGDLFGVVDSGNSKTAIQYVTIDGGAGRLVNELKSGKVENCMSTAKVTDNAGGGGLVGQNSGTVSSSYYYNADSINLPAVGGSGTVTNCFYLADQSTFGSTANENGENGDTGARTEKEITGRRVAYELGSKSDYWSAGTDGMPCLKMNAKIYALTLTDLTGNGGVTINGAFTDGSVQTFYSNDGHQVVLKESIAADHAVIYYPQKPTGIDVFGGKNTFYYAVGKKINANTSWYNDTDTTFGLSTADDLFGFAKLVNEGNNFSGKTVELAADIDLTGYVWTPIGSGKYFAGIFNGNNHKVAGMSVFAAGIDYAGLFGYVSGGTVQNVHVAGKVTAMDVNYVGGIVGQVGANSVVQNCLSEVTVTATGKSVAVGGVVGASVGTINLCWNKETVTAGNAPVGGVVGSGNAKNCANFGTVKGTSNAGGIAGNGNVENSYNLGDVAGNEAFTKGIGNGTVTNSYYVCKLNGAEKMAYVNTTESATETSVMLGADDKTYMAGEKKLVDVLNDKHGTNELWFTNPEKNVYLPRHATKWDGETDTDCTFKTITVTYDPNTGVNKDGNSTPVTVSEMVYVVGEDVVTPAKHIVLAADGETLGFKHENGTIKATPWNTDATGNGTQYAAENTIQVSKDITLYAQWDKIWMGEGSANDPYLISEKEDLIALATQVNNNGFDYNKKYFKLTADIPLTGEWTPIGNSITGASFNGNLNGNNKHITGLQITNGSGVSGLFGYLGTPSAASAKATIEKLTIEGSIGGGGQAGGLAGLIWHSSSFVLNDVHTQVSITGSGSNVGGIIGRVEGHASFTNCSNGAAVSGRDSVGGLVGSFVQGGVEFTSCSNNAAVTGARAAGICAGQTDLTYTQFTGCVNNGAISGTNEAAGISLGGTFTGCTNSQAVTSSNGNAAGIGINGTAEKCANHAGISGGVNAAGILWSTPGVNRKIEFCYNAGAVSGTYGSYGILAGTSGAIKNCFTYNTDKHVALCPVSAKLNVTNSYYLANSATELNSAGEYATLSDFTSGKVAWGVDGGTGKHENYWTQGANNYPVPIGEGTSTSYYRAKAECGTGGSVSIKSSRNFTGDADNAVYGPKGMSVTVTATPKDDTFGLKTLTLDLMGTGSTTALESGDSFTLGEANALVVAAFASTGNGGNGGDGTGGNGGDGDGTGTDTGDGAGDEDDEGLQDGLNLEVEYDVKGLILSAYGAWGAEGSGKTFTQWLKDSPEVLRALITNSLDNMAVAAMGKKTDEAKDLAALLLASLNEHSGLDGQSSDTIAKMLRKYIESGTEAAFSAWLTTGGGMASGTYESIFAQYTNSLLALADRLYANWESSGTSLTFPQWLDAQQVTMESLSENAEEPDAEPDDTQTTEAPEDVPDGQEAEGGASSGGNSVWEVIGTVVRENPIIVWSIVAVVAALIIVGAVRRYHKVKRDEHDDATSKK